MNAPKLLFQQDKTKSGQWRAIVNGDVFESVILHANSEFLDTSPTPEQQQGAKTFINILRTIAEVDVAEVASSYKRLNHDLDNPQPKSRTKKAKKSDE